MLRPRHLLAPAAALLAALLLVVAAAAQSSGERVSVTPGEGGLLTRFVFTGSGYAPGRFVSIRVFPPDGSERRMVGDSGGELVWQTGLDGAFELVLTPGLRFPSAPSGRWQALFCAPPTPTCQLVDFDVDP